VADRLRGLPAGSLGDLPPGLSVRASVPEDRAFLLEVYVRTRVDELAPVPWTDAQKQVFIAEQFEAQDRAYRGAYPAGRFLVVEDHGVPIGRLYLATLADEVRIIDVALLPEHRGRGIGSVLIAAVIAEAESAGLAVRLHVEPWNPARRLYLRFGFLPGPVSGIYERMERPPRPIS